MPPWLLLAGPLVPFALVGLAGWLGRNVRAPRPRRKRPPKRRTRSEALIDRLASDVEGALVAIGKPMLLVWRMFWEVR